MHFIHLLSQALIMSETVRKYNEQNSSLFPKHCFLRPDCKSRHHRFKAQTNSLTKLVGCLITCAQTLDSATFTRTQLRAADDWKYSSDLPLQVTSVIKLSGRTHGMHHARNVTTVLMELPGPNQCTSCVTDHVISYTYTTAPDKLRAATSRQRIPHFTVHL